MYAIAGQVTVGWVASRFAGPSETMKGAMSHHELVNKMAGVARRVGRKERSGRQEREGARRARMTVTS